jgi:hypothetical protein
MKGGSHNSGAPQGSALAAVLFLTCTYIATKEIRVLKSFRNGLTETTLL